MHAVAYEISGQPLPQVSEEGQSRSSAVLFKAPLLLMAYYACSHMSKHSGKLKKSGQQQKPFAKKCGYICKNSGIYSTAVYFANLLEILTRNVLWNTVPYTKLRQ